MTPQQLTTLKAAILADPALVVLVNAGQYAGVALELNKVAAPAFIVWKGDVTIRATGQAFNGAEWAGMTTANHTRLQTVAQYLASYSPALADIRAMFNDIWSGAGGATTRAALLALWKRSALRGEKILATGTGSDAVPATMGFEGNVSERDVEDALVKG
jgi:hypothetical protein